MEENAQAAVSNAQCSARWAIHIDSQQGETVRGGGGQPIGFPVLAVRIGLAPAKGNKRIFRFDGGVFGESIGKHARSAVAMAPLPFNNAVEVEMIVEVE